MRKLHLPGAGLQFESSAQRRDVDHFARTSMGDAGEDETSRLGDVQTVGRDMQTADVVRLVIIERVGRVGAMQSMEPDVELAQIFDIHVPACLASSSNISGW